MKKQTFYKQKKLKSQKSLEHSGNNFNNNLYEYPNYQIKTKKKNETNIKNSENNSNNINNNIKIDKKGKIGDLDYMIEPRNILLIPNNSQVDMNLLKMCEKELLPKEKNYFISEKNFQLIKDTLNEKEEIIKELNYLLEKYKNQNNNKLYINKENDISYENKETNNNNEKIKVLEEENKKLEKANNELILHIEKKNLYFNKMYQLLKFVFNYYNSFKENEIMNFIKEQDLEILFDNDELQKYTNNYQINDENSLIDKLFKTNKDMLINDLENYKKKYNDVRKQLNYITNLKYNDKNSENNNNQMIIEYQTKLNELYFSNQNYIKENTYLKLICQNMFLEKKISNITNNNENDNNKIIKDKDNNIKKLEKNIINLQKENEVFKKDKEELLQKINQANIDLNNNKEENKKIIGKMSQNIEIIKSEKEKLRKLLDNKKLNEEEKIKEMNLLNEEIEKLKDDNILLLNESNLQKKKIEELELNSGFKNLVIEKEKTFFYTDNNSIYNKNKINNKYDFNNNKNNNINNSDNLNIFEDDENNIKFIENTKNIDLLMLLYNKSKQLEQYINNDTNYEN